MRGDDGSRTGRRRIGGRRRLVVRRSRVCGGAGCGRILGAVRYLLRLRRRRGAVGDGRQPTPGEKRGCRHTYTPHSMNPPSLRARRARSRSPSPPASSARERLDSALLESKLEVARGRWRGCRRTLRASSRGAERLDLSRQSRRGGTSRKASVILFSSRKFRVDRRKDRQCGTRLNTHALRLERGCCRSLLNDDDTTRRKAAPEETSVWLGEAGSLMRVGASRWRRSTRKTRRSRA